MARSIRNMPMYASDKSYNANLLTLKERAEQRVYIKAYDEPEVNLGLCAEGFEEGLDGVYRREKRHLCPHDRRFFDFDGKRRVRPEGTESEMLSGCYYSCYILRPTKAIRNMPVDRNEHAWKRIEAVDLIPEVMVASSRDRRGK